MRKTCTLVVLFMLLAPAFTGADAAQSNEQAEVLTLEECMIIALENHPSIVSAESDTSAAASRIAQQSSSLKPSLSASTRHTTRRGSDTTSTGISLSQLVSDGGKTAAALKAARYNYEAASRDLDRTRQDVVYNVTSAYFRVLQAQWDVTVAKETLELYSEQLEKARAAYEAGIAARSDVTAAEVDAGNARLLLVRSTADSRRSRAMLENAMGSPDIGADYSLFEPGMPEELEMDLDTAIETAVENRPDFAAAMLGVQAAEANLRLQSKSMNPELSVFAGYDWSNSGSRTDDDWQVGLTLSIPLYDGGLSAARTEEARANLAKTRSGLESFRQAIVLEIRTALLDLEEARENIAVSGMVVDQARENLDLASGRYRVGVGSPLEVSQAAENYSQARKNQNQAIYEYHLALASLETSLGRGSLLRLAGDGDEEDRSFRKVM